MSSSIGSDAEIDPYTLGMPRVLQKPRPKQGARLMQLRKAAGLSQGELARRIGERQSNIAFWEQSEKPPRSDVLPKLAKVLGVTVAKILAVDDEPAVEERGLPSGGRVREAFEEVAQLPRRQQEKVVEFVTAFVEQYKRKAG